MKRGSAQKLQDSGGDPQNMQPEMTNIRFLGTPKTFNVHGLTFQIKNEFIPNTAVDNGKGTVGACVDDINHYYSHLETAG